MWGNFDLLSVWLLIICEKLLGLELFPQNNWETFLIDHQKWFALIICVGN